VEGEEAKGRGKMREECYRNRRVLRRRIATTLY
jgi:hypothetical protein